MLNKGLTVEQKRIFLIASSDEDRRTYFSEVIQRQISNATVFTAYDGTDALSKISNVMPHVLITDLTLPKLSGSDLIQHILNQKQTDDLSIIISSELPDQDHFADEVLQGKVQFLVDLKNEKKLNLCISKALNRLVDPDSSRYTLRFLAADQMLFSEGDEAESVFILRRGKLLAFKGAVNKPHTLGEIIAGEFVGEMAHINHDSRSASVVAVENSELIEIPNSILDSVLFSKPAWAQALMRCLSKRLKVSNEFRVQES